MVKLWDSPEHSVYRLYIQGWTETGGWSAAVDVVAFDEVEAGDLLQDYLIYGEGFGLPEADFWTIEAHRTAWWTKVWLKSADRHNVGWRFELRDVKEW